MKNRKKDNYNPDSFTDSIASANTLQALVTTKLNKPAIPPNYISRRTIFERFDNNPHLPLTLVSAATGCGKSATVSQWLDTKNYKYGWLSVDTEHNDVQIMIAYLVAMFKKVWPEKTFGLEYLLNGINVPLNAIISNLINDIAQLDEKFVLVFDDYHLINDEKIHEIINGILRHPPENFHLVIVTQMDPPLRLASLRAKLQLNELRMKDLAFSIDEALALRSLIARKADNSQVETLVQKSEGWVTGITVGLMGLAQGISIEKVLEALSSRNFIIAELLDEAVLHGLPIETQKYLEIACLVDRFSADLISSMIAAIDDKDLNQNRVEELIGTSRKSNLFLIPLDNTGEWYRFHHLFQSQVKKRAEKHFSEEDLSLLYKSASGWFEENGTLEDALRYAVQSKNIPFAIQLFARHRTELHNKEQIQRLERLISQFPPETRNNSLDLVLSLAILQDFNGNFDRMQQCLSRAKDLLDKNDIPEGSKGKWFGEYHAVSAFLAHMNGELEQSIMHADKAMELLPSDEPDFFREYAVAWYSINQQTNGNYSIALSRLDREFQSLTDNDYYFQRRLMQSRCIAHLLEGNVSLMASDGSILSAISSPTNFPAAWMIGIYSLACSSYLNNDLESVCRFYDNLRQFQYVGWPFWVMHHYFLICLSEIARGNWQKAERCLEQCEELADELDIDPISGMVNAFKVETYLRRNELDRAVEVSRFANFEPLPPVFYYYIPQLTRVKLLHQTHEKAKSKELLQNLVDFARVRHNKNVLIQTLAFQAVVYAEQGEQDHAIRMLNEILSQTNQMEHFRTFLDHGIVMKYLLMDLVKTQPNNEQAVQLLRVFEQDLSFTAGSVSVLHGKGEKHSHLLTKREIEILSLVNQGLENKEIADQLFLSSETVKKHLYRAYQKLEVKNRTAAVNKLKATGIFTITN